MIRMTPSDLWWLGSSLVRATGRVVKKLCWMYRDGG